MAFCRVSKTTWKLARIPSRVKWRGLFQATRLRFTHGRTKQLLLLLCYFSACAVFLYTVFYQAFWALPDQTRSSNHAEANRSAAVNEGGRDFRIALCTKISGIEVPFLLEWIEFHRLQGVDKFLFYHAGIPSNAASAQGALELEAMVTFYNERHQFDRTGEPLIELLPVSHLNADLWPATFGLPDTNVIHHRQLQLHTVADCVARLRQRAEWILHLDPDEFAIANKDETLYEFAVRKRQERNQLAKNYLYGRSVGFYLPAVNFGHGGNFWTYHNFFAMDSAGGRTLGFYDPRNSALYQVLINFSIERLQKFDRLSTTQRAFESAIAKAIDEYEERQIADLDKMPMTTRDEMQRYVNERHRREYGVRSDSLAHAIPALHPHIIRVARFYSSLAEGETALSAENYSILNYLSDVLKDLAEAANHWEQFRGPGALRRHFKEMGESSPDFLQVLAQQAEKFEIVNLTLTDAHQKPRADVLNGTSSESRTKEADEGNVSSPEQKVVKDGNFRKQLSPSEGADTTSEETPLRGIAQSALADGAALWPEAEVDVANVQAPAAAVVESWMRASAHFYPLVTGSSYWHIAKRSVPEQGSALPARLAYCNETSTFERVAAFIAKQKPGVNVQAAANFVERACNGGVPTGLTLMGKGIYDVAEMERSEFTIAHGKLRGCTRPGVHMCTHGAEHSTMVQVSLAEARVHHHQLNSITRRTLDRQSWRSGPVGLLRSYSFLSETMRASRIVRDESALHFVKALHSSLVRMQVLPKLPVYRPNCDKPARERTLSLCSPLELALGQATMCPESHPFVLIQEVPFPPPQPFVPYAACTDLPQSTSLQAWRVFQPIEGAKPTRGTSRVFYNATEVGRLDWAGADNDFIWNHLSETDARISSVRGGNPSPATCFYRENEIVYRALRKTFKEALASAAPPPARAPSGKKSASEKEREKSHFTPCPGFGEARCCDFNPLYVKYATLDSTGTATLPLLSDVGKYRLSSQ